MKDLVKLVKVKVRARVKFLRTNDLVDYSLFDRFRRNFKATKRICEDAYIDDIEQKVDESLIIFETFLGYFDVSSTDSKALFDVVKDVLLRFN